VAAFAAGGFFVGGSMNDDAHAAGDPKLSADELWRALMGSAFDLVFAEHFSFGVYEIAAG